MKYIPPRKLATKPKGEVKDNKDSGNFLQKFGKFKKNK